MLLKLIGRFFKTKELPASTRLEYQLEIDRADELKAKGDIHGAIALYKEYLKSDPHNLAVINNLGVCLTDVGNNEEASATFELAYALDDTFVPAVVNHAKTLFDRRRCDEAIPFLNQAWSCDPTFPGTYLVYSGVCFGLGEVVKAREMQLRAWLTNFDSLRYANSYLFLSTYADIDESVMAAEHRFWAETRVPMVFDHGLEKKPLPPSDLAVGASNGQLARKIRIGYWSPDFRNHSVRYFFRPLLENHDSEKFEVHLYHDIYTSDAQTELIKDAKVQFHDVYTSSDADLYELIRSHDLDIFVELAGHSSANRLAMLQHRFARLQITALGYPPTTGLKTVDAKVLDQHVITPDSSRYYAEFPLPLPSSFWCFDPMENEPVSPDAPVTRNGYITFACVGNIGKINERMLACWKSILAKVPDSRLLIRSINFEDPASQNSMRNRLVAAKIDISRVDLRKPEAGSAFFQSYGDIDIVLDTFPFNGGTTTCFATYMGVPVVSMFGKSLISRMGWSILSNLKVAHLAVSSESEYVDCAVALAADHAFLHQFRQEARNRFKESSLGNGRLFAAEFENACTELLEQKNAGAFSYQSEIPVLPADELVRRAHAVLAAGQIEAAVRILNHCLIHHANHGGAHLLVAQIAANEKRFDEAEEYLTRHMAGFDNEEKIAALISMTRWHLLQNKQDLAAQTLDLISPLGEPGAFDRQQIELYRACIFSAQKDELVSAPSNAVLNQAKRVHVLIPCDEPGGFEIIRSRMRALHPADWHIAYERCDEKDRVAAYSSALKKEDVDILLIVQKNAEIWHPRFFSEVLEGLASCDLLGISGATRWDRWNWRADEFACKAAGFLVESPENPDLVEIQMFGHGQEKISAGMAILDGILLAVIPSRLRDIEFDVELLGAEWLLEEDWTYSAARAGLKMSAHRNLGVLIKYPDGQDLSARSHGLMRIQEKYGFASFSAGEGDIRYLSTPVATPLHAIDAIDKFLG